MHKKQKTKEDGILFQFRPLEAQIANNLQVCGRNGSGHTAVVQQSQKKNSTDDRFEPSPAVCPLGAFAKNGASRCFVIDKKAQPLMPCLPARARIHKMFPYTIRCVDRTREDSDVQAVKVKTDPEVKTTGMTLVRPEKKTDHIIHLSELTYRGAVIRKKLDQRSNYRRRRRTVNLWYRKKRFDIRSGPKGWLAPSLKSWVDNTLSWVKKYQRACPVTGIFLERIRFDTHKLQNPDISAIKYQQDTLFGYEARQYLLEKHNRTCAYCNGLSKDPVLEIDHFVSCNLLKEDEGSNRVKNLAIAFRTCNQDSKKVQQLADWVSFLSKSPKKLIRSDCKTQQRTLSFSYSGT